MWFEHFLKERSHQSEEKRVVRAEQREEIRKDKERQRSEEDQTKHDEHKLLLYKTQLSGCSDIVEAGNVVANIHLFFASRPRYLKLPENRAFLEKYPETFRDRACYDSGSISPTALEDLKRDIEVLQILTRPSVS